MTEEILKTINSKSFSLLIKLVESKAKDTENRKEIISKNIGCILFILFFVAYNIIFLLLAIDGIFEITSSDDLILIPLIYIISLIVLVGLSYLLIMYFANILVKYLIILPPSKKLKILRILYKPFKEIVEIEVEKYKNEEYSYLKLQMLSNQIDIETKRKFINNYFFIKNLKSTYFNISEGASFLKEYQQIIDGKYRIEDNLTDKKSKKLFEIDLNIPNNRQTPDKNLNTLKTNKSLPIDKLIEKINRITRGKIKTKEPAVRNYHFKNRLNLKKIDWNALNKLKHDIGKLGEEIVLSYEREKLKKLNMDPFIEQIRHTSKLDGEGSGFDIVSFDELGNKIFIEVKSTLNIINTDFYFTSKEVETMEKFGESYYLYRVYNLEFGSRKCDIEIFKGQQVIRNSFDFLEENIMAKYKN